MEFIQKKTADAAVAHFLPKAADKEISLPWDRFEGQLPECGFCESGLSCRDCLQGPCISHPFRDNSKVGVCGKNKDVLAVQSLLRLVVKGTVACLDQVSEFAKDAGEDAAISVKELQELIAHGNAAGLEAFPKDVVAAWREKRICPEGIARDLFKAAQKLEGGVTDPEHLLLWAFKAALLGFMAKRIQESLKKACFAKVKTTEIEINLGVLKADAPNLLMCGSFSPILKQKIAAIAKKKGVNVAGICCEPFLSPHVVPPATSYGSQDVALMTGAVDLVVAGDQFVNPSLTETAKNWRVTVIPTETLNPRADLDAFAQEIVDKACKTYETRSDIKRDIPDVKAVASMGYAMEGPDIEKIAAAFDDGKVKGIVILCGSNNVKFSQDHEFITMTEFFLANDFLCLSEGEASVILGKHHFLNPKQETIECGKEVATLLSNLNAPPVIDCDATEFLLTLVKAGGKTLREYPIFACFPEASRSEEVTRALGLVAMGVNTYFYPHLPVSGSPAAMSLLTDYCMETFGARLNVVTRRLSATEKAKLLVGEVIPPAQMSGKTWQ